MLNLSNFVAKALASNTSSSMVYMPAPYEGDQVTIWGRFLTFCQNNLSYVVLIVILALTSFFFLIRAFKKKNKKVK